MTTSETLTRAQKVALNRVDKGIALLDDRGPRGWRKKVRVTRLNMRWGGGDLATTDPVGECLLAQLYGDYLGARQELKLQERQAVRFGFSIADEDKHVCWPDLDWAWRLRLQEQRRKPRVAARG